MQTAVQSATAPGLHYRFYLVPESGEVKWPPSEQRSGARIVLRMDYGPINSTTQHIGIGRGYSGTGMTPTPGTGPSVAEEEVYALLPKWPFQEGVR